MATIDIIILIVIGAGAIVGFVKGFIRQLASILGLIVGLMAAKALYASLAEKLCPTVTDCRTIDLCIDCLAIDKSNAGYFAELAESLVRKWAGST